MFFSIYSFCSRTSTEKEAVLSYHALRRVEEMEEEALEDFEEVDEEKISDESYCEASQNDVEEAMDHETDDPTELASNTKTNNLSRQIELLLKKKGGFCRYLQPITECDEDWDPSQHFKKISASGTRSRYYELLSLTFIIHLYLRYFADSWRKKCENWLDGKTDNFTELKLKLGDHDELIPVSKL